MFKVRITWYDPIFWENSPEVVVEIKEKEFYKIVQLQDCLYDEALDIYYTKDNSMSYEIIG